MSRILFINSCPSERGISRTLRLCDCFIQNNVKNNDIIEEVNLYNNKINCYSAQEMKKRNELVINKKFNDDMFKYARQFAMADKIIIGAPYWDLSFPSVLKAYIEMICVNGITFHYTNKGAEGLSKFSKMMYITSCGGYSQGKEFGSQYIKAISEFLGKGEYMDYTAMGLDIIDNDVEEIMKKALKEIKALSLKF